MDALDWQAEYEQLRAEVRAYSPELAAKPHCVVLSKMDLLGDDEPPPLEAPAAFSGAARTGLDELIAAWWRQLLAMRQTAARDDAPVPLP